MKQKFPNGTINPLKCNILKKCGWCGGLFTPTHHSQKFCNPKCYREHRKEYKARWKRENINYDEVWYTNKPDKTKLGNSNLIGKPKEDIKKEEKAVKNELKRIGL